MKLFRYVIKWNWYRVFGIMVHFHFQNYLWSWSWALLHPSHQILPQNFSHKYLGEPCAHMSSSSELGSSLLSSLRTSRCFFWDGSLPVHMTQVLLVDIGYHWLYFIPLQPCEESFWAMSEDFNWSPDSKWELKWSQLMSPQSSFPWSSQVPPLRLSPCLIWGGSGVHH